MRLKWCGAASAVTATPVGLGGAHDLDAAGGGQVQEVDAGSGEAGELDVAVDHQLLGDRRPAGQSELAAAAALVHHRPLGEPSHLAVLGEDDVEPERVLHRPAHQQRVLHAVAVVGEDPHAGGDELGERRQRLARAGPAVMQPAGSTSHSPAASPRAAHELDHAG